MIASDSNSVSRQSISPHHNPCAQCGKPIVSPEWSEPGGDRVSYLWSCDDCGYQFATIAIYRKPLLQDNHPIAA